MSELHQTDQLNTFTGDALDDLGRELGFERTFGRNEVAPGVFQKGSREPDAAFRERMRAGTYEMLITSPEWPRRGLPPQTIRMKFGDRLVRMSVVKAAVEEIVTKSPIAIMVDERNLTLRPWTLQPCPPGFFCPHEPKCPGAAR